MRKFLIFWVMVLSIIGQAFAAGAPSIVIGATTVDTMFAKRLLDMKYTFIDVRSAADFQKGHVPGDTNLEFNAAFTSESLSAIVEKGDAVIFYGVGALSDSSSKATKKALEWGWSKVFYFRHGYNQWSTVGLEVE